MPTVVQQVPAVLTIRVERLPEGVYLGTSDDLPGLVVETDTREEMIELAPEIAFDLLEAASQRIDRKVQKFAFIFER